jgi:hypothetical protein
VSYHEARVGVSWSPSATLAARASGAWRRYGDTETTVVFESGKDDGVRADLGVRWLPRADWTLDGAYRIEWGPGAFLSSADASARYQRSERLAVTGNLTSFQQIEELRFGDGRALGAGASVDYRVSDRATLGGGLFVLRHQDGDAPRLTPWNQSRAWTSLRIELGNDPGLAARRAR